MKLRIKGNSIRLRLSKPEIIQLEYAGYLEERTPFGNNNLIYALRVKDHDEQLSADFDGCKLSLFIPLTFLTGWAENEIVGFESRLPVNANEDLYLLVEKDFKCLDSKIEEPGNYENPLQSHQQ